jgi:ketosteroid isomerase-like protein
MPITDSYVKSAFDKMTGGDIPGVMAMIHDDAEWTIINPKIQSTPLSGKYGVSRGSGVE